MIDTFFNQSSKILIEKKKGKNINMCKTRRTVVSGVTRVGHGRAMPEHQKKDNLVITIIDTITDAFFSKIIGLCPGTHGFLVTPLTVVY